MLNTDSYAKSMDLAERVSQLEAKEAAEKVIQDLCESVMFLKMEMVSEDYVEVIDDREYLD